MFGHRFDSGRLHQDQMQEATINPRWLLAFLVAATICLTAHRSKNGLARLHDNVLARVIHLSGNCLNPTVNTLMPQLPVISPFREEWYVLIYERFDYSWINSENCDGFGPNDL